MLKFNSNKFERQMIDLKELMNYLNEALSSLPEDKYLHAFKKRLVEQITERANEITHTGIMDDKVIYDIIVGEHPDIRKEFADFKGEINATRERKSKIRKTILGSALYFAAVILIFLIVSFITHGWRRSWIFLINGFCLYFAYMSANIATEFAGKEKNFKPISRILFAFSVFTFAVPVFLIVLSLRAPHAWLVFIFAILVMFTVDGIFVEKEKIGFAIFFQIGYIVPALTMVYIIAATLGIVHWHPGWIIILLSIPIILAVILYRLSVNKKHKSFSEETEADSEWTEN